MTNTWSANTSLSLNTVVAPTDSLRNNGLFFRVIQSGSTGSTEPNWSKTVGETVYDNTVRYVSFSSTFGDIQSLNPSGIIELFIITLKEGLHYPSSGTNSVEVEDVTGQNNFVLSNKFYYHSGSNLNANNKIRWQGIDYFRFPVQASGFGFQKGKIPRPKLVVSNATGLISSILLTVNKTTTGNDLTGATLTRVRTLVKFLDASNFANGQNSTADPTAEFPRGIYFIDRKSVESREVVEFELSSPTDLMGVKIPKRKCTRVDFPAVGTFK